MKKKLITICATLSVILLSTSVATAINTVDPDAFAAGTDISTAFWGVTLSSRGNGWNMSGSYKPVGPIIAVDPSGRPMDFDPSTGNLAFGTKDKDYPHLIAGKDWLALRADFTSSLAVDVSLDFIGNSEEYSDVGVLEAYDAGGSLVDSAMTGTLWKDDVGTLTVADAGGIAYILAYGSDYAVTGHTLGADNLQWTAIPAPGAILLGSIGIGLVGWLRRRRTL